MRVAKPRFRGDVGDVADVESEELATSGRESCGDESRPAEEAEGAIVVRSRSGALSNEDSGRLFCGVCVPGTVSM